MCHTISSNKSFYTIYDPPINQPPKKLISTEQTANKINK